MVPTPSQTVGPFFGFALPFDDDAVAARDGMRIEGQVLDGAGDPVPDALLELSSGEHFGRCRTDPEGTFHFVARRPEAGFYDLTIFARGLLRHLNTRIYEPGREGDVPVEVDESRRHTLVAKADGEVLRFDVRLRGQDDKDETVFFE
jgi:protocatechuate 3,4-dioxygenase alpha subunit